MPGVGGISASPNPVTEGGSVTVHGEPGDVVYWQDDTTGDWHSLPLDNNGDGSFEVPLGSEGILVSDRKVPRSSSDFVIVESST